MVLTPQEPLRKREELRQTEAIGPKWHDQVPDLSKLVRCLEDGLSKVVYVDDRMISMYGEVEKAWTTGSAGAEVRLYKAAQWRIDDDARDLFGGR